MTSPFDCIPGALRRNASTAHGSVALRLPTTMSAFLEPGAQRRTQMTRMATRVRLLAITALVALSLGAFAGGAAAASGPDFPGACNMLHALKGGLYHAWVVENPNGWAGKWVSIDASGCDAPQFPQPTH